MCYKVAGLRLPPPHDNSEQFKTLGNHKEWVDDLEEDTITASAK